MSSLNKGLMELDPEVFSWSVACLIWDRGKSCFKIHCDYCAATVTCSQSISEADHNSQTMMKMLMLS